MSCTHKTAFALIQAARKKGGVVARSSPSLLQARQPTDRTPNAELFIGVAEVSRSFGLPALWIERLTVQRYLTHYRLPGLGVVYRRSEIERDLQKFKFRPCAISETGSEQEHEPAA